MNAVERQEIAIDTTAAVVKPPLRRNIACTNAPGIDSNTSSTSLPISISLNGSSGDPAMCSSPRATRTALTPAFRSESTRKISHANLRLSRCECCTTVRRSCIAKLVTMRLSSAHAPTLCPLRYIWTMLIISDSISMILKPAPRPSRSRIPGDAAALHRFAIVRSIGRNHTHCCAVARNAGYFESDSSTASSGAALMRKIAAHPRPIVAASTIVNAAGSAVGTSCATMSKLSSPIHATSMASRGTSTHVLSKAVTRTNWMMAEARSDLLAVFAASMSPWPRATPS